MSHTHTHTDSYGPDQNRCTSSVRSDPEPSPRQRTRSSEGRHTSCVSGQSPIYNEPFSSMESGACALALGLLQPQTGRPVTKHCTAHGLTTTTAPGHWRTRSSASVTEHDTRTRPEISKRVSMNACGTECVCVRACAWGRAAAVELYPVSGYFPAPVLGAELFREACRGGR